MSTRLEFKPVNLEIELSPREIPNLKDTSSAGSGSEARYDTLKENSSSPSIPGFGVPPTGIPGFQTPALFVKSFENLIDRIGDLFAGNPATKMFEENPYQAAKLPLNVLRDDFEKLYPKCFEALSDDSANVSQKAAALMILKQLRSESLPLLSESACDPKLSEHARKMAFAAVTTLEGVEFLETILKKAEPTLQLQAALELTRQGGFSPQIDTLLRDKLQSLAENPGDYSKDIANSRDIFACYGLLDKVDPSLERLVTASKNDALYDTYGANTAHLYEIGEVKALLSDSRPNSRKLGLSILRYKPDDEAIPCLLETAGAQKDPAQAAELLREIYGILRGSGIWEVKLPVKLHQDLPLIMGHSIRIAANADRFGLSDQEYAQALLKTCQAKAPEQVVEYLGIALSPWRNLEHGVSLYTNATPAVRRGLNAEICRSVGVVPVTSKLDQDPIAAVQVADALYQKGDFEQFWMVLRNLTSVNPALHQSLTPLASKALKRYIDTELGNFNEYMFVSKPETPLLCRYFEARGYLTTAEREDIDRIRNRGELSLAGLTEYFDPLLLLESELKRDRLSLTDRLIDFGSDDGSQPEEIVRRHSMFLRHFDRDQKLMDRLLSHCKNNSADAGRLLNSESDPLRTMGVLVLAETQTQEAVALLKDYLQKDKCNEQDAKLIVAVLGLSEENHPFLINQAQKYYAAQDNIRLGDVLSALAESVDVKNPGIYSPLVEYSYELCRATNEDLARVGAGFILASIGNSVARQFVPRIEWAPEVVIDGKAPATKAEQEAADRVKTQLVFCTEETIEHLLKCGLSESEIRAGLNNLIGMKVNIDTSSNALEWFMGVRAVAMPQDKEMRLIYSGQGNFEIGTVTHELLHLMFVPQHISGHHGSDAEEVLTELVSRDISVNLMKDYIPSNLADSLPIGAIDFGYDQYLRSPIKRFFEANRAELVQAFIRGQSEEINRLSQGYFGLDFNGDVFWNRWIESNIRPFTDQRDDPIFGSPKLTLKNLKETLDK